MTTAPTLAPEVRTFGVPLELRDAQVVGKPYRFLEGRAVPYGEFADVGWYLEAHAVDSFKRSAGGSGKRLPLLLFHDMQSFPIGHSEKWSHAADGLHGVWRLNDSPEAQRAAQAVEAEDMVGLSVGYLPLKSDWQYADDWAPELGPEHKDKVTRVESRLLEVSLTPTPVYESAGVACVRTAFDVQERAAKADANRPPSEADAWRARVDALRLPASD